MVSVEKIRYKGWDSVWQIRNGSVELLVTADVGPRILHFGFEGGENEFYEVSGQDGLTGGQEFRMYGGHRLWVAPETASTAYPDNRKVEVSRNQDSVLFSAPPESNGLQKSMQVQLSSEGSKVRVVHRIQNVSDRGRKVSAWALTVLRPGGHALLPLPVKAPHGPDHLQPVAALALWSYTDLTAPCWNLGPDYLKLDQRTVTVQGFGMQKIGMINKAGWGAYVRNKHVFTKQSEWREGTYVDSANFEMFANKDFIELETLSPEEDLSPGASCVHTEQWSLRLEDANSQ